MKNALKEKLEANQCCINGWVMFPSMISGEMMARGGWDSLTIDLQHGVQDYLSAVQCMQAIAAYPVTPVVRVPWNEPGIIGKVLDAGAWGVICPMINTASEAKALVDACLYPPMGRRSNGPIRAAVYGVPGEYQEKANDEILVLPMIETREGVVNIDEILAVPGVSGIYVGPGDLGLAYGLPPKLDREEPEILDIYTHLLQQTRGLGLVAGIQNANPAYAARMAALGFNFITVGSDAGMLANAAKAAVTETRAALGWAA